MLFNRKFFTLLLMLTVVFLFSTQVAEAKGVINVIAKVFIVVVIIAIAVLAAAAIAQIGLIALPGIFSTYLGTAIVVAVMVGAGLLAADCLFDKGNVSANPIDPNIICTSREGGAGVSALQVDVRVNGSDGPVEFIAPANFKVQWAISGSAESCSATGNWSGSITNVAGKAEISNVLIGNYSYGIRCTGANPSAFNFVKGIVVIGTGAGQSASDSVIVNVVSPLPAIDFKGPDVVEIPDSITLFWATERAGSLMASGDWSGSKQVGPLPYKSETFTKPRGSYTFILAASNSSGGSATSQVNTRVIQVPRCAFSADPVSIIPPKYSTLSWSCQYADACSIDQGIGSVNPVSGTKSVRPSQTTTYTLTCSGLDGSRSYQTTVNVGFTPKIREIIPR